MPQLIPRHIGAELAATAAEFPVVTITGPRQAGKTTLARMHFPDHTYANLESPDIRALARADANAFFSQFPAPLIIDEIQQVPELLSYIQVKVDQREQRGQFILALDQNKPSRNYRLLTQMFLNPRFEWNVLFRWRSISTTTR